MASSNLDLSRMGGRVNADTGILLGQTDIDRMGGISMQSLMHMLEVLFFDDANGVPISGFPRDQLTTDHCSVSATSDLGWSVSTGWGLFFNSAAAVDEFGPARYLPIVLDTAATGTLAAHHATLPRIDLLCIAPAWVSDQAATRNVKDPLDGSISAGSVNQRLRFGATVQVVTGTPGASPAVPATPAGYLAIGTAAVPATTGAAVWSDIRPVLELGHYFKGLPRYATSNYVPLGGASELEVAATSPASMAVTVTRGRAVTDGQSRFYAAANITIAAAHATQDRIDIIIARANGNLDVVAGTPALVPSVPATPANACLLAEVLVDAAVTSIVGGRITDRRAREPFTSTQIQQASIDPDRMAQPTVLVTLSGGAYTGDKYNVDVDVTYADGSPLPAGTYNLWAELWEVPATVGVGPAEYGEAGGINFQKYNQPPTGSPPDYALADTSGATALVYSPIMKFTSTEAGRTISVRRKNNTKTGTLLLMVGVYGEPGSVSFNQIITFT